MMSTTRENKIRHYSRRAVVEAYESVRFGTPGGQYVDRRELDVCRRFLPDGIDTLLDAPVGTGRLSAAFADQSCKLSGLDSSAEMLNRARRRLPCADLRRGDIFRMPFPSSAFDASFCLRFTFHTDRLADLFREEMRVVRPGGRFIFDTVRWSPKALLPRRAPSRMHIHPDGKVERLLEQAGATVLAKESMFILPTFAYSSIPRSIVRLLTMLETVWPSCALSRVFWATVKN